MPVPSDFPEPGITVSETGWRYIGSGGDDFLPADTTPGENTGRGICSASETLFGCTRYAGHSGPHQAGTGVLIVAVWTD